MSNKQTAVEWLVYRIKNQHLYDFVPLNELEKQAKEMEKDQIMKARIDGDENHTLVGNKRKEYAQQYYKDTYES